MTTPPSIKKYFGLREAADYLTERCGRPTSHASLSYDIQQTRIIPTYLSARFLVLSREQLDEYADKGETTITIPEGVLLTKEQAAEASGLSTRNLRRLIDEGRVPYHVVGGKWVIEATEVPGLIEYKKSAKVGNPHRDSKKK